MTNELPAPLVPADCDLRDFPATMIHRHRLRGSAFNATANDAEWRAGVNLWLISQDQIPAGSLPENDVELCRLADLGRDLKTWRKVKAVALHGWFKCSDGRLYHRVVAEIVNKQWQAKIDQRRRTLKARIAIFERRLEQATTEGDKAEARDQLQKLQQELRQWQLQPPERSVTDLCNSDQVKRREVEEKGVVVPLAKANGRDAPSLPLDDPNPAAPGTEPKKGARGGADDPWKAVYDRGKQVFGRSAGGIITNLRKTLGEKPVKVLAKIEDAAEKRQPIEWINAYLYEHGPPGIQVGAVSPLP